MKINFVGMSHVGQIRTINEDSFAINEDLQLAVVADGMGGHSHGEVASKMTVENFEKFLIQNLDNECPQDDDQTIEVRNPIHTMVHDAIVKTNTTVHHLNEESPSGSTIVGMFLHSGASKLTIFHVGDSRAYLLRNGHLRQLTKDHSIYQLWKDSRIGGSPPPSNILSQAIGPDRHISPDIQSMEIMQDDLIILCSDGLYNMVDNLTEYLSSDAPLDSQCKTLIDQANRNGGTDNITIIIAKVHATR